MLLGILIPANSRHTTDKSTRIFIFDKRHTRTNMAAAPFWASQIGSHFVKFNIPVAYFDKQLDRALQPNMKAANTGRFNQNIIFQVSQSYVFLPCQ